MFAGVINVCPEVALAKLLLNSLLPFIRETNELTRDKMIEVAKSVDPVATKGAEGGAILLSAPLIRFLI
jgi:hypothetical protein